MRRSSPEEQAAWRHECQQYEEDGPDVNDHPPEEPDVETDRPATAAEIRHYPSYDSVYDLPF